ncbi:hypothetical protein L7F22_045584 [Adiantum nelumboides]|nr:hypothetical protein [Adiantum nelumboides]
MTNGSRSLLNAGNLDAVESSSMHLHKVFPSRILIVSHIDYEDPRPNRKKLDDKSRRCILVGYSDVSKAYKLYDPIKKESFTSRDVIFDENASFKSTPNAEDTSSPISLKIDVPSNIQEEIIEEIDEEDGQPLKVFKDSKTTLVINISKR